MKLVLSIVGEKLDPEQVSAILGGQPRKSGKRGDSIAAISNRKRAVSKAAIAGYWQRSVTFQEPKAADSAVAEIFAGLTEDHAVWRKLSSQFRAEISLHGVASYRQREDMFSADNLELFRLRGLAVLLREK